MAIFDKYVDMTEEEVELNQVMQKVLAKEMDIEDTGMGKSSYTLIKEDYDRQPQGEV